MELKKIVSLIFAIFLSGNVLLSAQKIYVSPLGNDFNPGSADKPLATLNAAVLKAREMRNAGESAQPFEIIVSGGEYFMMQPLVLTAEDSGTEKSPLVIRGEQGEKAILRGGVPVEGWRQDLGNAWRRNGNVTRWHAAG